MRPPKVLPIRPTPPKAIMVGVGREHAGEHQQRQHHVAQHDRVAQDAQLRHQLDAVGANPGAGERQQQEQRLGEGNARQHPERRAPAERIRDQHADRDAEDGGRHDAEGHHRDGAAGARRADQLHGGGAGQ
ncbi:hypothetical protein G6F31_020639 [Rhizopus arrhizus]|nr:hypothetical protein G6F31_020639 [Rhizopus arrhizus]